MSTLKWNDAMADAGFQALDKRGFRPAASDLGSEDLKAVFMAMYLVAPTQYPHLDPSVLGLAELGLPLAVLKEAFTAPDSPERLANMDVADTIDKAYRQFERVRRHATAVLADMEQANHRIEVMADALRHVQKELDGETPEDIDYGTVRDALALAPVRRCEIHGDRADDCETYSGSIPCEPETPETAKIIAEASKSWSTQ